MSAPERNRSRRRPLAGFSVIELLCVVAIIGCLARLAVPAILHTRLRTRASAFLNDCRVFAEAYQRYGHEKGAFPASTTTAGSLPTEMRGYVNESQWARTTPLGGNYGWDATLVTATSTTTSSSSSGNSGNSNASGNSQGKGNAYAKGRGNSSGSSGSSGASSSSDPSAGTGRSFRVTNSTLTIDQHTTVDALIDDGDIATGNYQVSDAGFTVVFYIGS